MLKPGSRETGTTFSGPGLALGLDFLQEKQNHRRGYRVKPAPRQIKLFWTRFENSETDPILIKSI